MSNPNLTSMVLSDTGILPNEPQNRVAALSSTMIHPNQCVLESEIT